MTEFKIIGYNNDRPSVIDEITCSIDGSIQIDSANVPRLKFQLSGPSSHALGEIAGEQDGVDGGQLEFYTKVDTYSLTEKLRINNVGAIGISGANYGISGQVLTSGGSGGPVSWSTPSGGGGGGITSFAFMSLSASQQVLVIKPTFDVLEFDITRTADPTGNIVLDTSTNIGRVNITDTGTYKIDIALTGDTAGTNRIVVIGQLYVNGVADTNCICYSYCRDQNHGENTGNINAILTLPANSYLELHVSRNSSTQAFVIVGTNIAIMKIA